MKKKTKTLSKLLNVDLKPLEKDSEGNLVGGFALVDIPGYTTTSSNNSNCYTNNGCKNTACKVNVSCAPNTYCSINNGCEDFSGENIGCTNNGCIGVTPASTGTVTTSGFGSMYAF